MDSFIFPYSLLDLFITNIQENDILPIIEMILEVEDKPNHLPLVHSFIFYYD